MKTYLRITEIANLTQKERSTITRWIKAGKFGSVRQVGKEYQVPHENFKKWWDKNMNSLQVENGNG